MKNVLIASCLLLAFATLCTAQQISLVAPVLEAELVESPFPGSVLIQMTLRAPESDVEAQASLDDIQFVDCTAVAGTKRAVVGLGVNPSDVMQRTCMFAVGTAPNNLPPDWNKLTLELKYRVREGQTFGSARVFRGLSPITRCIKVSNVTATLGLPTRTGDREVTVPIKLNADMRLNVEVKTSDGSSIATPSGTTSNASVLFENNDQFKSIALKVVPGTQLELNESYLVAISQLASQPSVNVQMKGTPASFTVSDYIAYKMPEPAITQNDDGSVRVVFSTPTSGSMQVFLNGRTDPVYSDNQTVNRDFIISADKVSAGVNTLTFAGESGENRLKLSGNSPRVFNREPRTYLKEKPVTFNYDEPSNKLKIKFSLSRGLGTRWRFKDSGGLGADVQAVDQANNQYEASIDLNLSAENAALVNSKLVEVNPLLKRAPVEIEIYNANKTTEVVAAFVINFVKPNNNVKDKLQAADTLLAQNKKDQAKAAIAEALGLSAGGLSSEQKQTIDAIISQLREPGQTTKGKVFKILAIAGKFAAGMFGIPLL